MESPFLFRGGSDEGSDKSKEGVRRETNVEFNLSANRYNLIQSLEGMNFFVPATNLSEQLRHSQMQDPLAVNSEILKTVCKLLLLKSIYRTFRC